jgi:CDP-diglyceride synthetase
MDLIFLLHDRLATTVILFFAVAGLWGLFEFARGGALSGSIAGILIIGQALVMVQGLLGVALYIAGYRPATIVHVLYGVTAAIVLPFLWSYVRDRAPRQGLLLYSLVALFIVGLAIRGMTTGS